MPLRRVREPFDDRACQVASVTLAAMSVLFLSLSWTAPGRAAPAECPLATLSRTACFGTCPAYDLKVYTDGRVDYFGRRFVRVCGAHTASLKPGAIRALRLAFERADYFGLDDEYTRYEVTDNPSAFTSYCDGARTKSVKHYYGDHSAPQRLTDLETRIDEIVGTKRWVVFTSRKERKERGFWLYHHDPCQRDEKTSR